jgi:hypothetical protein
LAGQTPWGTIAHKKAISGGYRGGKSMVTAAELWSWLPWTPPDRPFWIIGADYDQSRSEFTYLKTWADALGLVTEVSQPQSDAPWRMTLITGHTFRTFSAYNLGRIAGATPGAVALVEAGKCPAGAYRIAEARAGLQGVPLVISGTLEEDNWYDALVERWSAPNADGGCRWALPTWSNTSPGYYPGGRADPKIQAFERTASREDFQKLYAGERVPPPGLVFGPTEHHPGFDPSLHVVAGGIHLMDPPKDPDPEAIYLPPDSPVVLGIDPGWEHKYAVVACVVTGDPRTVYVLDEIWETGMNTPQVLQVAQARPWWRQVTRGVIDIAGKQHQGAPLTNRDYWAAPPPLGAGLRILAEERVPVSEGTAKIRKLLEVDPVLGRPRLLLDRRVTGLAWELRSGYRNTINRQGVVVGTPRPIDDDAVKALIYLVQAEFPGLIDRVRRRRTASHALPFPA